MEPPPTAAATHPPPLEGKKRRGSHSTQASPSSHAKRRKHTELSSSPTLAESIASAALVAAASTMAAAILPAAASSSLAGMPALEGGSVSSVLSAAHSRSRRQPKSRQLFGDDTPSSSASTTEEPEPKARRVSRKSTERDLAVGRKKRTLKNEHGIFVRPSNDEASSPLFSRATYLSRDPLAAAAAAASSASALQPPSAATAAMHSTTAATDHTTDGDETEDDEVHPDAAADEDPVDGDEEMDEEMSVAESSRSTRTSFAPVTRTPFTFHPLNHQPWIASFVKPRTLPLGAASTTSSTQTFIVPVPLEHALRSDAFRRTCRAQLAYSPLDSWFLRGFDGSASDESDFAVRYGPSDGFHRLLAARVGAAPADLPARMTRPEWSVARRMLGWPRRLSQAFLNQERARLHHARNLATERQLKELRTTEANAWQPPLAQRRKIGAQPAAVPSPSSSDQSIPSLLPPGSMVFAPHPRGQLAPALVIEARVIPVVDVERESDDEEDDAAPAAAATNHHTGPSETIGYLLRFDDQPRGATSLVPHHAIVLLPPTLGKREPQSAAQLLQLELLRTGSAHPRGHAPPFLHAEADHLLLARLLQLVDRKKLLLDQLRIQNAALELMREQPSAIPPPPPGLTTCASSTSNASVASGGGDTAMEVESTFSHPPALSSNSNDIDACVASVATSSTSSLGGGALGITVTAASPSIVLTPAQFAAAYQLFQRQYAAVVLQLETTSQNLETTMTQLRLRRASARRSTASQLVSSSGLDNRARALLRSQQRATDGPESVSALRDEAGGVVAESLKDLISLRVINKASVLADPAGSAIQPLITSCITLVLLLQRCVDEGRDAASSVAQFHDVLQSMRPRHAAHQPAFQSICRSIEIMCTQLRARDQKRERAAARRQ